MKHKMFRGVSLCWLALLLASCLMSATGFAQTGVSNKRLNRAEQIPHAQSLTGNHQSANTHVRSNSLAPNTFGVLWNFGVTANDGQQPWSGLIQDSALNLYGTTTGGGTGGSGTQNCAYFSGYTGLTTCGTVFKLSPNGTETVLWNFTGGDDGAAPYSSLLLSNGKLYGTATNGGPLADYDQGTYPNGVIFEIDPPFNSSDSVTTLYGFPNQSDDSNGNDGAVPRSGLISDSAGNFYGTTLLDDTYSCGTVFQYAATGVYNVLYVFTDTPDGCNPTQNLVMDASGNLYGTTTSGGAAPYGGAGTVFELLLNHSTGAYTYIPIYSFAFDTNGSAPNQLAIDSAGNLYSTTQAQGPNGGGTVFKFSNNSGNWSLTTLYAFTGGSEGAEGGPGGVVLDNDGNLYGTTVLGAQGKGALFELVGATQLTSAASSVTVLHAFKGDGTEGFDPYGALLLGADGNLYGTMAEGGSTKTASSQGYGTVWGYGLPPAPQTLSVTITGDGVGTVTSVPSGISCPGTCSYSFPKNSQVTLTETPGTKSAFANWSGACTGNGSCTVTMSAAESVTASFSSTAKPSTTTLTSSVNPSQAQQPVTYTVTVAPTTGTGTPTGTVTFYDGSTPLGTGTLNGTGKTTYTTSTLPIGSNSITAVYGANSPYAGSTSNTVVETVNTASDTVAIISNLPTSAYGQSVTFTASVTPQYGSCGGAVTFYDGTTSLGSVTLASDVATLTTNTLPAGSNSITAVYSGDGICQGNTSTVFPQVVNLANTTTTFVSSINPGYDNVPLTFTATVASQYGAIPTGTVAFNSGTTTLGSATLTPITPPTGPPVIYTATFSTTLAAGSYSIKAVYSGDSNDNTSSSSPLTQTVAHSYETVLHAFTYTPDGSSPYTSMVADSSGNFYGTAHFGGVNEYGSVFELSPDGQGGWHYNEIYSFSGLTDGAYPESLTIDSKGNLYGTSSANGIVTSGYGNVWEISPTGSHGAWILTHSYTFTGTFDGAHPGPGTAVVIDSAGNVYGTTTVAGAGGSGTVFELTPVGGLWQQQTLYAFTGGKDGGASNGSLIMDSAGNLYGTTLEGGASGLGVTFKFSPAPAGGTCSRTQFQGNGWCETVLHSFAGHPNDGNQPSGNLIFDRAGNLYGTTSTGLQGTDSGFGGVYKLTKSGQITWLHSFLGGTDGFGPQGGVVFDNAGNLYGTTVAGGVGSNGIVFELKPPAQGTTTWIEDILYSFTGGPDGGQPLASPILDAVGNLYGTTITDGVNSGTTGGVVFKLTTPQPTITWPTPAAIAYGTKLSTEQLDAKAYAPGATTPLGGKYVYTPAAGTVLQAGTHTLSVTFTPTSKSYQPVMATVTLTVNQVGTKTIINSATASPTNPLKVTVDFTVTQNVVNTTKATGTVTVTPSTGETPCTGTLSAAGTGSCTITFSKAESTKLTATYSGDANNLTSTSVVKTLTVK